MRNRAFRLWWAHSRRVRLWFWFNIGGLIWMLTRETVVAEWELMAVITAISGATLLLDYLAWKFRY